MKIYIDVTNLVAVNFVTGIQRVVIEILTRLLKRSDLSIYLLAYVSNAKTFNILDNKTFLKYYSDKTGSKSEFVSSRHIDIDQIECGSVFFDIDSVWNSNLRRSWLLPKLKNNGVKIALLAYDIIPITHPQYCHQNTTFFFMDYIGAFLMHADIIISSAKATRDAINDLSEKLGLDKRESYVIPLGSDFKKENNNERVDRNVIRSLKSKKYALIVGTIEPRKNHELLLKAFDKALFDKNICLVFAGKFGWNIDELKQKIENHPKLNKKLFHFTGVNDATIDYLYKNAFVTLFPTFNEGYGLPLVESIERGTPVLASDIAVLREIGTDFCGYFDPYSEDSLIDAVSEYLYNTEKYKQARKHLNDYVPITWDKSADLMAQAVLSLNVKSDITIPPIKQMVVLSARSDMMLETIPFIEHFMPFIKEIVLCCPDSMAEKMKKEYHGLINLKYLTDSMVLNGNALPEDHACRNYYLRCLAFQNNMIDDAFIMSDDDYRPMFPIEYETFVRDGKYVAYYCHDLSEWKGTAGNPTSYDVCQLKLYNFLSKYNYPTKQFSSHMPQAIDKRLFMEMLEHHPGIEHTGIDEWSSYFNISICNYPDKFETVPYVTMSWPGAPTDWNMKYVPNRFLFENFYPEQYEANELFEGFSTSYNDDISNENIQKTALYLSRYALSSSECGKYDAYEKNYGYLYSEKPIFLIDASESPFKIYLPKYVSIGAAGCTRISFDVHNPEEKMFRLEYYYTNSNGDRLTMPDGIDVSCVSGQVELPVFGMKRIGKYVLNIVCSCEDDEFTKKTGIVLI